jgi:flagellar biosynthesis protein FliR
VEKKAAMDDLTNWMLVYLRLMAFLTVFPLFSVPNIPVRIRAALGAMLALLVAPTLTQRATLPPGWLGAVGGMTLEIGIGLLLGFICRMLFYILEFAGGVISMEVGLNMAAAVSPMTQNRGETPGLLLFYLGAILFLTMDLHHWLLLGMQRTFLILPIGGVRLQELLFQDVIRRTGQLFLYGLLIAAPIVAVSFLINLVFSVLGRAVPQMNIFIESFSFRLLAGLSVFGLTLNLMAEHIASYLKRLPEDLLQVTRLLSGG